MSETTELLPLEGATSKVWEYFGFPAKDGKILEANKKKRDVVHCKCCGKRVKYNGNTTNLRVHIRDTHSKLKYTGIYCSLRKRRQPLLRYARNASSLPLLRYMSVVKYSPDSRRDGISSPTLYAILSLGTSISALLVNFKLLS